MNLLNLIQPDDWHVHLREGEMMDAVVKYTARINRYCIAMPNLNKPIKTFEQAIEYKRLILKALNFNKNFTPLIPCYLTDDINLKDFKFALEKQAFIGAKLYPNNVTTNSSYGVTKLENIYPALQILSDLEKPLLVHGEKVDEHIDIFDREKYFIDDELSPLIKKFPNLKIILEHISSKYGADFVNDNENMAGTITPQHMMLTKKDVFAGNLINPHHFCMPVVKNETDLVALRKYACSGNKKFFLGTDSAPHHIDFKIPNINSKAGIFSSPCSIEIYASIFDEENSIINLESFASINGPLFYNLPINNLKISLERKEWQIPEYTVFKDIKIKNFMGGEKINWKLKL